MFVEKYNTQLMIELSSFQIHMLFVISGSEKPNGASIKRSVNDLYDNDIIHSRIYSNLDELLDEGHLEKGKLNKRTNYYETTEYGEQKLDEYQDWLKEQRKATIEP